MAEDSPILRMTSEDLPRSAANSASVQTSSPSITGCFTPLPTVKKISIIIPCQHTEVPRTVKGVSHEMDLALEDMHGQFKT